MTKILSIEIKQDKNGNDMKVCQLEGAKTVYVNSKYEPELYPVVVGDKDVEIVQDGKFWKIKPESFGLTSKPKSNFRQEGIEKNMGRKENSIVLSGTMRDATMIVTSFYKDLPDNEIKEKWLAWRKWLIENAGDPKNVAETTEPF